MESLMISTTKLITIDRYITMEEGIHPEVTREFIAILHDLTFAIRIISAEVRRAGLNDILGLTRNINIHGEKVAKVDEFAHAVIVRSMEYGGHVCTMASEESTGIIHISPEFEKGKYVLCFDPLDGSTNIDTNITIGSIFSLYRRLDTNANDDGSEKDILQPGYKQVFAGYALYGSSTIFVYTTGRGVNVFTLDPTLGEFLLTKENIKIPQKGNLYSCNEANYNKWHTNIKKYLNYIKSNSEDNFRPYYMRYIATAVADIHRMFRYGGIYMYPSEIDKPDGKIRLCYEANPMAFIVEQAGGKAITDNSRILDVIPTDIHQRVPFYLGSPENIDELMQFMNGNYLE